MTLSMSKPGFESQLGYKLVYIFFRGYSSIGKTTILHIVILGSSPNISKYIWARKAQPGRAEL